MIIIYSIVSNGTDYILKRPPTTSGRSPCASGVSPTLLSSALAFLLNA